MRRVPMQLSAPDALGRGRVPPVRGFIRRWQGSDQRLARFDSAGTYSTKREAPQAIDDAYGRRERVDTLVTPGAQYCTGIGQRKVHHLPSR